MFIELLDQIKLKEAEEFDNLVTWLCNGAQSTIAEFRKLDTETKQEVIDFMGDFILYEEVYSLHDLVWERADYDRKYYEDTFVITGHTPTQTIEDNPKPGYIYRKNNHIAIDCGANCPGGRLAAICLDTDEEYYSSPNKTT